MKKSELKQQIREEFTKALLAKDKNFAAKFNKLKENKMSDDDIEYAIFVEGPTFTNSQEGGHPFYDFDLKDIIKNGGGEISGHEFNVFGDEITMSTKFNPYDYVDKESFDNWWNRKSKNNHTYSATNDDSFPTTLLFEDGVWWIVSETNINNLGDGD